MVKTIVDDIQVKVDHHRKTADTLTGSVAMHMDSEATLTITCRVNSRDKTQWDMLHDLIGCTRLEVELKPVATRPTFPDIKAPPRTDYDLPIGRKRTEAEGCDLPESSQGKETW
jgi:hypothetical protein